MGKAAHVMNTMQAGNRKAWQRDNEVKGGQGMHTGRGETAGRGWANRGTAHKLTGATATSLWHAKHTHAQT